MEAKLREQLEKWGLPSTVIDTLEEDGLTTWDLLGGLKEKDLRKAGVPKLRARAVARLAKRWTKRKPTDSDIGQETDLFRICQYLEISRGLAETWLERGITGESLVESAGWAFAEKRFTGDPKALTPASHGFGANPDKFQSWVTALEWAGRITPEMKAEADETEKAVLDEDDRKRERAARARAEAEKRAQQHRMERLTTPHGRFVARFFPNGF